jgi:uncharacterized protein (TIGR00255 family)
MTAFASSGGENAGYHLNWEIRGVNHRHLDIALRLPEAFRTLEPEFRACIGRHLKRGRVEASLQCRRGGETAEIPAVNLELARRLMDAVNQVQPLLPSPAPVSALEVLRWPGVLGEAEALPETLAETAESLLEEALRQLVAVREREGAQLAELILARCQGLREQVARARERLPAVLDGLRDRMRARIEEVCASADPARLEQEMAIIAQRLDVAEEMDRLSEHLDEIGRILSQKEPVGRRLDFLMQELNREANTLGSKSQDMETTRASVEMKVLIEQMREQVQNLE